MFSLLFFVFLIKKDYLCTKLREVENSQVTYFCTNKRLKHSDMNLLLCVLSCIDVRFLKIINNNYDKNIFGHCAKFCCDAQG